MATDRYVDLLRQGFMKPRKAKVKAAPVIVACVACRNWHPIRKHTVKDAAVRRANLAIG